MYQGWLLRQDIAHRNDAIHAAWIMNCWAGKGKRIRKPEQIMATESVKRIRQFYATKGPSSTGGRIFFPGQAGHDDVNKKLREKRK